MQADISCQRDGATVDDAFELRLGIGKLHIILGASCLRADPGPRFQIHGQLGSFCKRGLDVQEEQLRRGESPLDPSFGCEPDSQCGSLTSGNSLAVSPVASEPGRWLGHLVRLRECAQSRAPPPVLPGRVRQGLRIIEAARQSSESGRRVPL